MGLARLHAEAGDHAAAAQHVRALALRRRRSLDRLGWGAPFALRHLAEIAARLHDRRLAADLLPVLAGYSGQMLASYTAMTIDGAADTAIGLVHLTLGRPDEAVRRLAAGQRTEERFGATALAARTAHWHARALLRRAEPGDRAAAHALLADADAHARRLGLEQVRDDVAALAQARG